MPNPENQTTECPACKGSGVWGPFSAGMAAASQIDRMTPSERMAASSPCGLCDGTRFIRIPLYEGGDEMTNKTMPLLRRVWVVRPAFAMNHKPVEVGPEDNLADLVERAMDASPTSEVLITQEMRK